MEGKKRCDGSAMPLEMGPDDKRELETLFSTLSVNKQRFLETRIYINTDKGAAELCNIAPRTIKSWKLEDAGFKKCYEIITTNLFNLEKNIVMAVERSNAVTAVREKQKLLVKPWEACTTREAAAKTELIKDTLERIAPKRSDPSTSVVLTIQEILQEMPDAVQNPSPSRRQVSSDESPRSEGESDDSEES